MRIIYVTSCLNCPYLRQLDNFLICNNSKSPYEGIGFYDNYKRIPKWCPLIDISKKEEVMKKTKNKIYSWVIPLNNNKGEIEVITDFKKIVKLKLDIDFYVGIKGNNYRRSVLNLENEFVAIAKCNLDAGDKFDFKIGFDIAYRRLMEKFRKWKNRLELKLARELLDFIIYSEKVLEKTNNKVNRRKKED